MPRPATRWQRGFESSRWQADGQTGVNPGLGRDLRYSIYSAEAAEASSTNGYCSPAGSQAEIASTIGLAVDRATYTRPGSDRILLNKKALARGQGFSLRATGLSARGRSVRRARRPLVVVVVARSSCSYNRESDRNCGNRAQPKTTGGGTGCRTSAGTTTATGSGGRRLRHDLASSEQGSNQYSDKFLQFQLPCDQIKCKLGDAALDDTAFKSSKQSNVSQLSLST